MLDIHDLMQGLAEKRPVFHNEADFQFALASYIREEHGQPVRLEWKPFPEESSVDAENEYTRFGEHLKKRSRKPWSATFAELRAILGKPLPPEAKKDRNWWGNCWHQPQARAWIASGWRVNKVDLVAKTIGFRRVRMYMDLWLPEAHLAIELKYGTRKLVDCDAPALDLRPQSESFSLRDGAADMTRYDFLKDVERLEWVVARRREDTRGIAVLLTNDPLYWEVSKKRNAKDSEFHLHEGRELCRRPEGMDWAESTSEGTRKGKDVPIVLNGSYHSLEWTSYRVLDGDRKARNRTLRYLAVEVPPISTGAPEVESPKNRPSYGRSP